MEKQIDTGGPAFPIKGFQTRAGQGFVNIEAQGMNLRDYFAAQAMSAYIGRPNFPVSVSDEELSQGCYEMADAMLKARK